jgi:hypothetical protein
MQDFVNTIVLICTAIASLGLGVALAFGLCRAGFAVMRAQARSQQETAIQANPQAVEA